MTLSLDPYPIAGRMHLLTKAYVKPIPDGRYTIIGPMITGMLFDMGPAVGLSNGGVDLSVISGMMQAFDNGQMRVVGFDPREFRIVEGQIRKSFPFLVGRRGECNHRLRSARHRVERLVGCRQYTNSAVPLSNGSPLRPAIGLGKTACALGWTFHRYGGA